MNWDIFWKMALIIVVAASGTHAQKSRNSEIEDKKVAINSLHPTLVESPPPTGIILPSGYRNRSATDFEGNVIGELWKPGGATVRYEMGLSQGQAVDDGQKEKYLWYKSEKIENREVRIALLKDKLLLASVPLDNDAGSLYYANFSSKVVRSEDLADTLLIVIRFAYIRSTQIPGGKVSRWPATDVLAAR